mmetsp:Transcript_70830/g.229689  ORF Transcript_70830/g.229689 Transcript_70830/m.229689 type:complete len:209 (-) Transcript_70830:354-980(-)
MHGTRRLQRFHARGHPSTAWDLCGLFVEKLPVEAIQFIDEIGGDRAVFRRIARGHSRDHLVPGENLPILSVVVVHQGRKAGRHHLALDTTCSTAEVLVGRSVGGAQDDVPVEEEPIDEPLEGVRPEEAVGVCLSEVPVVVVGRRPCQPLHRLLHFLLLDGGVLLVRIPIDVLRARIALPTASRHRAMKNMCANFTCCRKCADASVASS